MSKMIITDCDGVLLDWNLAFTTWMERKGYRPVRGKEFNWCIGQRYNLPDDADTAKLVFEFNESAAVGFMEPFRDAESGVRELKEAGYSFYALTSLSTWQYAEELRRINLENIFGKDVFDRVHCLSTGAPKGLALYELSVKYPGAWFIDDHPHNVEDGVDVGLKTLLFDHMFNKSANVPGAHRVATWSQVCDHILGDHDDPKPHQLYSIDSSGRSAKSV
jgi:FMN phosphatase YigB (HAD superfamily)